MVGGWAFVVIFRLSVGIIPLMVCTQKKKKNTIDGEKEEKGSFHNIYMWSHMEENLELAWEEFVNRVERVDLLRPLT